MSDFKPLDRSGGVKPIPGELLKQWTAETEAARAKLLKDLTCPNCGFLMVYGPCAPACPDRSKADE